MNLADIEREKEHVHKIFSKADTALHEGKITRQERDKFLEHKFGSPNESDIVAELEVKRLGFHDDDGGIFAHRAVSLICGFFVVMVTLFATLFFTVGDITGAVVMDITVGETYAEDTSLSIALNGTTKVNVSGIASGLGDVTITLLHDAVEYLLYEYHNGAIVTPHASMPKRWYEEGEVVTWTATHVDSAYLITADDAILLDNTSIQNLTAGEYTVKLLINDTNLSQEELPFIVVPAGAALPEERFSTCGDACHVNLTGNGTLELDVNGASVTIERIVLHSGENTPPVLDARIPDFTAATHVSVDLSLVFSDPDGDELLFASSHYDENDENITNGVLTITGEPGAYTYVAYASDMKELTSSNMFAVTFTGRDEIVEEIPEENQTNETIDVPQVNRTNETQNRTIAPTTTDCSHPDPNKRPLSCIQETDIPYFKPEEKYIENKRAIVVGKFTPIGNLLIKGDIVEYTIGSPDPVDYQLGYEDVNGDFVPTVWISTETGDLHLKGRLTEANENIPVRPGLSAIANTRGIVLALIDRNSGDLTVRGNVIPYRRSFA